MQRRMFRQHNQVQQASWLSEHDIVDVAHSINFGMRLQRKQRAKVARNTKKKTDKAFDLQERRHRAGRPRYFTSTHRVLKLDRLSALPKLGACSVALD